MRGFPRPLFFRLAIQLTALLPETMARRLGETIGYLASFVDAERLRMAERHMRRVLGHEADSRGAARAAFSSYGRYWAELFWMRPGKVKAVAEHVAFEGLDYIRAAQRSGRGMILALPHVGNWEVAAQSLVGDGIKVTVVAEAVASRHVTEWFLEVRRMLGMEVLLAESGRNLAWVLARRLKAGGAVALLSDRDITGNGIEVQFFRETTTLPAGPAILAEMTGAPILPIAVYFRGGRGHRAVVVPPLKPAEGGSREERIRQMTQNLAYVLEALIREAPTQWHLLQPNWPSDREMR